jgi:hypothetical protein
MTNLGRRLVRLEARLLPKEDKIAHHIIRFVEGNGTVTGSMVINFDDSQCAPRGGRRIEPRSRKNEPTRVPMAVNGTYTLARYTQK